MSNDDSVSVIVADPKGMLDKFLRDIEDEMKSHDIMGEDQVVIAPTAQTAAYLRLKIAEQGIYTGIKIKTAQELIVELRNHALERKHPGSILYGDPWSEENMTWRIARIITNNPDVLPKELRTWLGINEMAADTLDTVTVKPNTFRIFSGIADDFFDWIFSPVPNGKRFVQIGGIQTASKDKPECKIIERNLDRLRASFKEMFIKAVKENNESTFLSENNSDAFIKIVTEGLSEEIVRSIKDCLVSGLEMTEASEKQLKKYRDDDERWRSNDSKGKQPKKNKTVQKVELLLKFSEEQDCLFQQDLQRVYKAKCQELNTSEGYAICKSLVDKHLKTVQESYSKAALAYRMRRARRLPLAKATAQNFLRYLDEMPELLISKDEKILPSWQAAIWRELISEESVYGNPAQFIYGLADNIDQWLQKEYLSKKIYVYGYTFFSISEHLLFKGLRAAGKSIVSYEFEGNAKSDSALSYWMPQKTICKEERIAKPVPVTTFHKCMGVRRQVNVIQDLVVDLVNKQGEAANPEDIAIVTPNIDEFSPLLTSAFKRENQSEFDEKFDHRSKQLKLWFSRGQNSDKESDTNRYLLELLALVSGPASLSNLIELLLIPSVMRAAYLSEEEMTTILDLLKNAQVAWGWDSSSQQRKYFLNDRESTIEYGLRCIASAVAIDPGEKIYWETSDSDDAVYVPKVEAALTASIAARATYYIESLRNLISSFNNNETQEALECPLDDWTSFVVRAFDDRYYHPNSPDEAEERYRVIEWAKRLGQIVSTSNGCRQVTLTWDEFYALVKNRVAKYRISKNMIPGAIAVCSPEELFCIPYKYVILAGITDKNFPLRNQTFGNDALANVSEKDQLRNRTSESLAQLYMLLYGTKQIDVIFDDRSENTGKSLDTPIVIEDMRREFAPREIVYKLFPFQAPEVKEKAGEKSSQSGPLYSYRDYGAVYTSYAQHARQNAEQYYGISPEWNFSADNLVEEIDLDDMIKFFQDPTEYFVKRVLGIYIQEENQNPDGLFNDKGLSRFEKSDVQNEILTSLCLNFEGISNFEDNIYTNEIYRQLQKVRMPERKQAGLEPLYPKVLKGLRTDEDKLALLFGKLHYAQIDDEPLLDQFDKVDGIYETTNISLDVQNKQERYRIHGTLNGYLVSKDGDLALHINKTNTKNFEADKEIGYGIRLAVWCLSEKTPSKCIVTTTHNTNKSLKGFLKVFKMQLTDDSDNLQEIERWLNSLVAIYQVGRQIPLPLYMKASKRYEEKDFVTKDDRKYQIQYDKVLWGEKCDWESLCKISKEDVPNYHEAMQYVQGHTKLSGLDKSVNQENNSIFVMLSKIIWGSVSFLSTSGGKGL